MKCTNCGSELQPGTKFCTNCGCKVEEAYAPQESSAYAPGVQELQPKVEPQPVPFAQTQPQMNRPAQPITRENRYTPLGEKGSTKPAIVLVIIYAALGILAILASLGINILQLTAAGAPSSSISQVVRSNLISGATSLAVLIIGLIPVVIALIARRKYLWKIRTKDVVVISLYSVLLWITAYLTSIITSRFVGYMGVESLSAVTSANAVIRMTGLAGVMDGFALAAFILARTKAKAAAFIVGGVAALVALFLAVLHVAAPAVLLRLFVTPQAVLGIAGPLIRVGGICQFFISFFTIMMGICYGFASYRTKRWIPIYLIIFFGRLVLTFAVMALGIVTFHWGPVVYSIVYIIDAILMLICALIMMVGAIKNRKEA